ELDPDKLIFTIPNNSLIISPHFVGNRLCALYWSEDIFGGQAVTDISNIVFRPIGEIPTAWLLEELASQKALAQLQRASLGSSIPRLDARSILEVRIPSRSPDEIARISERIVKALVIQGVGTSNSRIAIVRKNLSPFVLTGATFEDRLDQ